MATLLHEIWEEPEEDGGSITLCLAGLGSDAERKLLVGKNARLVTTFEASSHAEAMRKYYALYDYGEYKPFPPFDEEPYPEEWAVRQRQATPPA